MPTPTSKIPLPKTSLSSSKLDQDMTISSTPTVSKIPVIKNLKSPAHEIRCVSDKSFVDVSAKNNTISELLGNCSFGRTFCRNKCQELLQLASMFS